MEELLNKLIEKGWKPRGIYTSLIGGYGLVRCEEYVGSPNNERKSYRELVSKESGLWQFCCDSKLIEQGKTVHDFVMKHICYADENRCGGFSMCNAEYYIMMCSLLDESELEQFLLDNIKI